MVAEPVALPGLRGREAREPAVVGVELARPPALHAGSGTARRRRALLVRERPHIRRFRRTSLYSPAHYRRSDTFHAPPAPRSRPIPYILGLNAYHADAAACLVKDGELVAAV